MVNKGFTKEKKNRKRFKNRIEHKVNAEQSNRHGHVPKMRKARNGGNKGRKLRIH